MQLGGLALFVACRAPLRLLQERDGAADWRVRADMRKAMPRDVHRKSVVPLNKLIRAEDLEFD